jgi:hypothetical protein
VYKKGGGGRKEMAMASEGRTVHVSVRVHYLQLSVCTWHQRNQRLLSRSEPQRSYRRRCLKKTKREENVRESIREKRRKREENVRESIREKREEKVRESRREKRGEKVRESRREKRGEKVRESRRREGKRE